MGFMASADQAPEILTVATAMGKASYAAGPDAPATQSWQKARLFVLEDRTAVLIIPDEGRAVERLPYTVVASDWAATARRLTVVVDDGGILSLDGRGCGCNMGAVGGAGPVAGPYRLSKVRAPEWHTVSR